MIKKIYKPKCHAKYKTPIITRCKKPENVAEAFKLMYFKTEDLWLNYTEEVLYRKDYQNISKDYDTFSFIIDDIDDLNLISELVRRLKKYNTNFNPYNSKISQFVDKMPIDIRNAVKEALHKNLYKQQIFQESQVINAGGVQGILFKNNTIKNMDKFCFKKGYSFVINNEKDTI